MVQTKVEGAMKENGSFIEMYKMGIVVPAAARDLKKKLGEEFASALLRSIDLMKPLVEEHVSMMTKLGAHIQVMQVASPSAGSSSGGTKRRKVAGRM